MAPASNKQYETALEKLNAPVSLDYGSLRQRRLRVVALYGGYAVICAGFWLADASVKGSIERFAGLAIVLAGFAILAHGFFYLMRRTFINSAHLRDEALDERQRVIRDRAMRNSYILLSFLITLQALYFMIASDWKGANALVIPSGVANAYFWGAFLFAMTLPTAWLAWTTPDVNDEL